MTGPESDEKTRRVAATLHDVRGLLSPAMLSADGLTLHADPQVRAAAEQIIQSIEQAVSRLKALGQPKK
ncbi:conserved hypothetical protein [Gluconacetobacter diazotrophicus PA1 5]|uniref:Uncharacterized protein n=2 Tax=Gluconacetobacter diazotrophicus TaxID=33996 RepID=A9HKT1_GLUDA|nr:hypothetical protein [Gluconacetobacter diazotrophicus]ACI50154.1 conserved hypothetical protein [Gluconacetobacter diazotrophicus PA1 5]MBB2154926.1 hypothetical protein [Gluconacetobacter diazotrophicus]TWB08090.1 hypothetical protein FBZ86_108108 [Gluconacetobacter diazotrophicus]CAP56081.1 hypothetical protein GDI2138 [Gluconacetobacter diazotrophicus PA1 5]